MDLQELVHDERFNTNPHRVEHREALLPILSARFKERNNDEWGDVFAVAGLAHGPINDVSEVFSDPQVLHRDMLQEVEHPTAGKVRLPGMAVKYTCDGHDRRSPNTAAPTPPPLLGEHTRAVLTELGYNNDTITHLHDIGAIELPSTPTSSS